MKAILVIKMPKSCFACPLWDESDYADGCMVFRRRTHDIDHGEQREEWCPLKPMPAKHDNVPKHEYELGWNDCIEEIEG